MTEIKTIVAETHEQYEQIEHDLLRQGFSLFLIEGKRIKYDKWKHGSQTRVDIFMKFWD